MSTKQIIMKSNTIPAPQPLPIMISYVVRPAYVFAFLDSLFDWKDKKD